MSHCYSEDIYWNDKLIPWLLCSGKFILEADAAAAAEMDVQERETGGGAVGWALASKYTAMGRLWAAKVATLELPNSECANNSGGVFARPFYGMQQMDGGDRLATKLNKAGNTDDNEKEMVVTVLDPDEWLAQQEAEAGEDQKAQGRVEQWKVVAA